MRRAVEETVEHLRSELGEEEWAAGMHPDIPETKILDNPYTYTEFRTSDTHRVQEDRVGDQGSAIESGR